MLRDFLRRQLAVWRHTRQPRRGPITVVRRGRGPVRVVHEEAVVHETTSVQGRIVARGARLLIKPLLAVVPFTDTTLRVIAKLDALSERRPRSRHLHAVEHHLGGVRVEVLTPNGGPRSDLTVLYFHGGGFFSGAISTHRRLCERLALYTGGVVMSVDYVQLPHGVVADSVHDAITAYAALLDEVEHPDKVVVAGDSAGGYLAMKVAELATRRELAQPAGIIGFSPLLSLDPDRLDKDVERVSRMRDAYLPLRRLAAVRRRWLPEGSLIEGEDSPLEAADLINSPTFMVAVEDEILRPEIEAMALQLAARGVDVDVHLWRGQVHAFPVLADVMPESRTAVHLAAEFARGVVGEVEREVRDDSAHTEPMDGEVVSEERAS